VRGTNIVIPSGFRDSGTVWTDPIHGGYKAGYWAAGVYQRFESYDGVHWSELQESGPCGDRSTFYFDALRKKWVYSIRGSCGERARYFHDGDTFEQASVWAAGEPAAWISADDLDGPSELYNLDCAAYESVLLGMFTMLRGQPPERPKLNEICLGFSRDGFHWTRPDRTAFISYSDNPGDWNYGNVQSTGGCYVGSGDQLFFYVSGRQGRPGREICSTGLATLPIDGFASMDAGAEERTVTTKPLSFDGQNLFVNANIKEGGFLFVDILAQGGKPLAKSEGYFSGPENVILWDTGENLWKFKGVPVRFRFRMKNASLFSFWVK